MEYEITTLKSEHAVGCYELQHEEELHFHGEAELQSQETWHFMADNLKDSWVCLHEGKVVGFIIGWITLVDEEEDENRDSLTYFTYDCCATKNGMYPDAMKKLLTIVWAEHPYVTAWIHEDNTTAIEFSKLWGSKVWKPKSSGTAPMMYMTIATDNDVSMELRQKKEELMGISRDDDETSQ